MGMNWKGCAKKWSWPNLRHYPYVLPGNTEKKKLMKILSQGSL